MILRAIDSSQIRNAFDHDDNLNVAQTELQIQLNDSVRSMIITSTSHRHCQQSISAVSVFSSTIAPNKLEFKSPSNQISWHRAYCPKQIWKCQLKFKSSSKKEIREEWGYPIFKNWLWAFANRLWARQCLSIYYNNLKYLKIDFGHWKNNFFDKYYYICQYLSKKSIFFKIMPKVSFWIISPLKIQIFLNNWSSVMNHGSNLAIRAIERAERLRCVWESNPSQSQRERES